MCVIWFNDRFNLLENGEIIAFSKLTDKEITEIKEYYKELVK